MMKFSSRTVMSLVVAMAALAASPAWAVPVNYTLTDGNTSVTINPFSSAGISNWTVDGINHLNYQWLWYRVGSGPELSFDNLTLTATPTLTFGRILDAQYQDAVNQFTIDVQWILGSGGPGHADLSTSITVNNTNTDVESSPLDITIFQYSDFDLFNTPNNDSVEIDGPTVFNTARQFEGNTQIQESVTVLTPDIYIADLIDGSNDLLPLLNDGSMTNFSPNVAGPLGPGNASWLFGWNGSIAAGDSMTPIVKDQSIVPEPASLALLGMGLALIARRKRALA